MSACEKCWSDASRRVFLTGGSTADEYQKLLAERKNCPCSPREQAGEYWDEDRQCDKRKESPRG